MKSARDFHAFTLTELLIVICVIALLSAVLLPALSKAKARAQRLQCIGNLKAIGVAMRGFGIAISTNGVGQGLPPSMDIRERDVPTTDFEPVFRFFQVMSNELVSPAILFCPADSSRIRATNFSASFSNTNVSYFLGVDDASVRPNGFLSGDRNLQMDGVPVPAGVAVIQNTNVLTWKIHEGSGNVSLSDGSVQSLSSSRLLSRQAVMRLAFP